MTLLDKVKELMNSNLNLYNLYLETSFKLSNNDVKHYKIKLMISNQHKNTHKSKRFVFLIVYDLNQEYEIKLLKDIDTYKDNMLSNVTHELRTPLNCNILLLEALNNYIDPKIANTYLIPALNSSKMLLSLINDILDFSQIKENKFKMCHTNFDFKKLMNEIYKLMRIQIESKGINFVLSVDEKIPNIFCSDSNRIRQVILNFLG